jgi:hypothetical protein
MSWAVRVVIAFDNNDSVSETILIPVIGLNLSRPWQVGRVLFHPAGAAAGLIEAASAASPNDAVLQPGEQSQVLQASARLNGCVVAGVSVSQAGGVAVAEQLVEGALAVLRLPTPHDEQVLACGVSNVRTARDREYSVL